MAESLYTVPVVCVACPFRTVGSQAVRLTPEAAARIAEDVRNDRPFCCHRTSTPDGLDTKPVPKGAWRFCAGAYLAMAAEERDANATLRMAAAFKLHDPAYQPAGEKVCFTSLDEFLDYYNE